jgi:hypothetical protein
MILDSEADDHGDTPVWKCLGCGRSIYADPERQAEDERLREHIQDTVGKPEPGAPT